MKKASMAIAAHARRCVLGVMDETGHYLDDWRFPTTESELIRYVAAVKAPHKRLALEEGPLGMARALFIASRRVIFIDATS